MTEIEQEKEAGKLSAGSHSIHYAEPMSVEAERKRSRLAATAAGQAAMTSRAAAAGEGSAQ